MAKGRLTGLTELHGLHDYIQCSNKVHACLIFSHLIQLHGNLFTAFLCITLAKPNRKFNVIQSDHESGIQDFSLMRKVLNSSLY